jgi:hypothetical protein
MKKHITFILFFFVFLYAQRVGAVEVYNQESQWTGTIKTRVRFDLTGSTLSWTITHVSSYQSVGSFQIQRNGTTLVNYVGSSAGQPYNQTQTGSTPVLAGDVITVLFASYTVPKAAQTITLSPSTASISADGTQLFTASGSLTGYVWGASSGTITGSGGTVTYTPTEAGTHTISVYAPEGPYDLASSTKTAQVTVDIAGQTCVLSPNGGSASIAKGQTFSGTMTGAQAGNQYNVAVISGPGSAAMQAGGAYVITANGTGLIHYRAWISAGNGYSRSADVFGNIAVTAATTATFDIPANTGTNTITYTFKDNNGNTVDTLVMAPGSAARIHTVTVPAGVTSVTQYSSVTGVKVVDNSLVVDEGNTNPVNIPGTVTAPTTTENPPPPATVKPPVTSTSVGSGSGSVWSAGNSSSDPSAQKDLLTSSIYREGVDKQVTELKTISTTAEAQKKQLDKIIKYQEDTTETSTKAKANAYLTAEKSVIEAAYNEKWAEVVGDFAPVKVAAPSVSASAWPTVNLPIIGTIVFSPYEITWLPAVMNVVREVVLWLMVAGFIRFGIEKAVDYSIQVSTVPNVTTTQDLLADAIPVVAEKVQWIKQGVTAVMLVGVLIVLFGASVLLINTRLDEFFTSTNIKEFISGGSVIAAAIANAGGSPLWGWIAEFFPLGAFLSLVIAETALLIFMSPVFLLASVLVRTLRA